MRALLWDCPKSATDGPLFLALWLGPVRSSSSVGPPKDATFHLLGIHKALLPLSLEKRC